MACSSHLDIDGLPRARLEIHGVTSMTDAELLCLVLGASTSIGCRGSGNTGTPGNRGKLGKTGKFGATVIDLARGLLITHGGLAGLARASLHELRGNPGIGAARASAVQAALELGRRSVGERPAHGRRIASADDIWSHLRARLATLAIEEFWAVALDVRHRVLWESCLARGSLTAVEVHPRDVFRPLIRGGAAAAIFCHNHPSGDPSPSQQDLELTRRLRDVGELCGIQVLDHVVVGSEGFVSLAQDRRAGLSLSP
jgi:DNA repair protein RadC